LKATRNAELATFWENFNLRSQLERTRSAIELFRTMSGFDPFALGEHIPAPTNSRKIRDLEPISATSTAKQVRIYSWVL